MERVTTIADLRDRLDAARCEGRTVGLVPTMGFLHEGHTSLIRRSAAERDLTVVTVFVNPLQFAAGEDLDAYPRDLERDTRLAEAAGATVLFTPEVTEMYPGEVLTTVSVERVSADLEGVSRPTHLAGVATVVTKLFAIVGACRAYFGEKDYQQLLVVTHLARDLSLPVEVVGCPTVRDLDGLALSSRNRYLTAEEREAAPVLYRALRAAEAAIAAGERDRGVVEDLMASIIGAEPLAVVDYAAARAAGDLSVLDRLHGPVRLLVAASFPNARLIDNLGASAP